MKKFRFIAILALSILGTICMMGQEQEDYTKKINKMVEMNLWDIEITKIRPMSMPSKLTRQEYEIKLKKDILNVDVPYIGRFDSAPMGTHDISIEIEDQKVDVQKKYNEKKKRHEIRFRAKDDNSNSTCDFYIEIFENGTCLIRLNVMDRDPITYDGELKFLDVNVKVQE